MILTEKIATSLRTSSVHFCQCTFGRATSFHPSSVSQDAASDQPLLGHAFYQVLQFDPCASHWLSPQEVCRRLIRGSFAAHSEYGNVHSRWQ